MTEINRALADAPEMVNKDPYGAARLLKLRLATPEEMLALLDAQAYEAYTKDLAK